MPAFGQLICSGFSHRLDPLWSHTHVPITPHIANMSQPHTAARVVIDNLRRHARGESLVGLVDRARGY